MSNPPFDGSNPQPPNTPPAQPSVPPVQQPMAPPAQPPVPPAPGGGYAPAPGSPGGGAKKGLAIAALILGIAAMLVFWVPVLGIIVAVVGLVLGIIALVKKQPKGFSLTGLILSAAAIIGSILATIGLVGLFMFAATQTPTVTPTETPSQTEAPPTEEPPTEEPPSGDDFPEVTESQLAEIAGDPDAFVGQTLTLYGEIVEYDDATGPCNIVMFTSHEPKSDPVDYEWLTDAYAGDGVSECGDFPGMFVEGDVLRIRATVLGLSEWDSDSGRVSALGVQIEGAASL